MKRRDFIKGIAKSSVFTLGSTVVTASKASENREYEFIIIGSGAGGGPLAVNLAKKGFSVLLIEAGGDKLPLSSQIPAYHTVASEDPMISWDYYVKHYDTPLEHAKWNFNTSKSGVLYPRSSVIGGCTASNAMICLYPDTAVWDNIYRLTGGRDRSWRASHMRKLFNERVENGQYFSDSHKGWHSLEMSPLSLLSKDSQLQKIVLGATLADRSWLFDELYHLGENQVRNALRLNSYLDANNPNHINDTGFLRLPKSTYRGKRFGVFDYVQEARKKYRNLNVISHTFVKKIIFEKTANGLKAKGVEVLTGENLYSAHKLSNNSHIAQEKFYQAQKEVIISAGAFNSPQLLMMSGIAPADQFEKYNRKGVLKGEPKLVLDGVGRNLKDRYEVSVVTELDRNLDLLKDCQFAQSYEHLGRDKCLRDWANYKTREKSVYATNGILASIKMKSSTHKKNSSDVILFGVPGYFTGYYPKYSKDTLRYKNKFTWAILKGHSANRLGRVKLNSDDCLDTPDIHFHYFKGDGADNDLQAVLEGVRKVRKINRKTFGEYSHTSRSPHNRPGKGEVFPGPSFETDSELKSWIQREAWGHHASCSNKMGVHPKDGSVVDTNFKVHGTTNLRIVDASVFPEIPGLFIAAPIYMISEKAAEYIIKKYRG